MKLLILLAMFCNGDLIFNTNVYNCTTKEEVVSRMYENNNEAYKSTFGHSEYAMKYELYEIDLKEKTIKEIDDILINLEEK